MKKYRVGIIGLGGIGVGWLREFVGGAGERWEVARICDISPDRLAIGKGIAPGAKATAGSDEVLADRTLDAVALLTSADARPEMIRKAIKARLHVIAEKPIAPKPEEEQKLLEEIEASDVLVAVNIFNRNAWYHRQAMEFIAAGEIGKLGIVRVCHMTPGLMPGQGHRHEGPCFRDCGMHYVDVARWYAGSEYDRWHAQGVRMWGEADPWWVSVHGTFVNGVAFEITQGFVYGQMARNKANNSYCECLGTRGFIHMSHDFRDMRLRMHGVSSTVHKTAPYGGKKFDVMIRCLTESLDAGRDLGLPTARDSVVASRTAMEMLRAAAADNPPSIGSAKDMEEIIRHKQRPGR